MDKPLGSPEVGRPEAAAVEAPIPAEQREIRPAVPAAERGVESEPVEETTPVETEQPSRAQAPAAKPVAAKDELTQRVEHTLSTGLDDLYKKMDPARRAKFRAAGEETTSNIVAMIRTGKIHAKKILNWVKAWLKLIPGVSKYFLEQEAKIKTDAVVRIADEEKQNV